MKLSNRKTIGRADVGSRPDGKQRPVGCCDSGVGAEVRALVEHALSDRLGDWRVSIVGSRENDRWEMTIMGPSGFEWSYIGGKRGRAPAFGDR
jgi:hypothetical protein